MSIFERHMLVTTFQSQENKQATNEVDFLRLFLFLFVFFFFLFLVHPSLLLETEAIEMSTRD